MRFIRVIICTLLVFLVNIYIFTCFKGIDKNDISIQIEMISDQDDEFQLFYSNSDDIIEENSVKIKYAANEKKEMTFIIPKETKFIRLDVGNKSSNHIVIEKIQLLYGKNIKKINVSEIYYGEINMLDNLTIENEELHFQTTGTDAHIKVNTTYWDMINLSKKANILSNFIIRLIVITSSNSAIIVLFIFSKGVLSIPIDFIKNRKLIWNLALNDFKTKYAGSYLGITWAFVQPVVTILVYWFVFQVGFKSSPIENFPYVLWLIAGLVPWFFFAEGLNSATNSMLEYSYLVKKVVFNISILPIVKLLSALFVHCFFLLIMLFVYMINGYSFNIYGLQIVYYSTCMFIFTLSITYATSAIIIFFKDLGQIISIFLQVGIWLTPIMWTYNMIPEKFQWILKINPMYYIVEGYRDAMINKIWFWEHFYNTIYFWTLLIVLICFGTSIFGRLKIHFADVI